MRGRAAPTPRVPERLRWAVELLTIAPNEHLLEIGCGPGHAVALICERLAHGTITAIDRSPVMVERARARNRACITVGRARVEHATFETAVFKRQFGKLFAINVNAFWTNPDPSFAALRRLMHARSVAYLIYEPPSANQLRNIRGRLPGHFEAHGLQVTDVREHQFTKGCGLCVIGTLKSPPST